MARFDVTYEIWSEESLEVGDTDKRGYGGTGMTLRDAIACVHETRTSAVGGSDCFPSCFDPRLVCWITVSNGAEFKTGDCESRSLHIPDSVTPSSRARIARLFGLR